MAVKDWTNAPLEYFHHFHQNGTFAICTALNAGRLPKGVFALVEQHSGSAVSDVLALDVDRVVGKMAGKDAGQTG